jgi:inward rectifier potassium channel
MNNKFFSLRKKDELNNTGLISVVSGNKQRLIDHDGKYTVVRTGIPFKDAFSIYQWLISMSWIKFFFIIILFYITFNVIFAFVYFTIGLDSLEGIKSVSTFDRLLDAFFFSAQTVTTVGYGRINPVGIAANIVTTIESLSGLLSLAFGTGLLYGRFSKPSAKLIFSEKAIIAPFKEGLSFQFRTANLRTSHDLIDVEATIAFSILDKSDGMEIRKFYQLELEYKKINFFQSTWTVNHIINEDSPLYGMTKEDFETGEAEFLVLLKGFDDTFSQVVQARTSYICNEVVWGAKFSNIYGKTNDGRVTIALDEISNYELVYSTNLNSKKD